MLVSVSSLLARVVVPVGPRYRVSEIWSMLPVSRRGRLEGIVIEDGRGEQERVKVRERRMEERGESREENSDQIPDTIWEYYSISVVQRVKNFDMEGNFVTSSSLTWY
ncbi:hypothetical protein DBV15_03795 [Temnothorax longispinosus]|uniref:Uncharacterized protein n=1 Tax=Temnothorax longispinosus TaxID=300112 RepID=A0A4S2JBQ6_9HYME|nr:hypothetical protein DBV15_03795 [Temnothorax longispinosus]